MKKFLALLLTLAMAVGLSACGILFEPDTALENLEGVVIRAKTNSSDDEDRPFVFYVIRDGVAEPISQEQAKEIAPEAISASFYDEAEETVRWFAQLIYVPKAEDFDADNFTYRRESWLATDYGEQFRVYYSRWSGAQRDVHERATEVMLRGVYFFHDGNPDQWFGRDYSNGTRILTSFTVISNGDALLVSRQEENAVYVPLEDGSFQLLLECPANSELEYVWFP